MLHSSRGLLALATPLLLAAAASTPDATVPWPIKVDVKITCGSNSCTFKMKVDTGATSPTMSRAHAIACGLLNADGSKKDPTVFGPDVKVKNANGTTSCFYKTKPGSCTIEATDSCGQKCSASPGIIVPSKGGPDIHDLLGTSFLDEFCLSSKKKSCQIKWSDWVTPPDPPKKKTVDTPQKRSTTPSERVRTEVPGTVEDMPVTWTLGTASVWTVLGDSTAQALGLTGTPIDLQGLDPEYFATLDDDGFLGDDVTVPFELASVSTLGVTAQDGARLLNEEGRQVLINRQSDENILSQDAIDELPAIAETFYVGSLDLGVLDLGAPDVKTFGTATPTTVGTPRIGAIGLPRVGNAAFALTGTGLVPNATTMYLLGSRLAQPVALQNVGGLGTLYVDMIASYAIATDAAGASTLSVAVPNDPSLCTEVTFQIVDPDPALPMALPFGLSKGLTAYVRP